MNHHVVTEKRIKALEEELSPMFAETQNEVRKYYQVKQSTRELEFMNEFQMLQKNVHRFARMKLFGVNAYISRLAEKTVMQRRVDAMIVCRRTLQTYMNELITLIEWYEEGVVYFLKCVAKSMGLIDPHSLINRLGTLHSLKQGIGISKGNILSNEEVLVHFLKCVGKYMRLIDPYRVVNSLCALHSLQKRGGKEVEDLMEQLSVLQEEYRTMTKKMTQDNLVLSNERAHLSDYYYRLVEEIPQLTKEVSASMAMSNQTDRTLIQIYSQIDSLHGRMTTQRGFESMATTPFDKLQEIKVRISVLQKAVNSVNTERMRHLSDVGHHRYGHHQSGDSDDLDLEEHTSKKLSTNTNAKCESLKMDNNTNNDTIRKSCFPKVFTKGTKKAKVKIDADIAVVDREMVPTNSNYAKPESLKIDKNNDTSIRKSFLPSVVRKTAKTANETVSDRSRYKVLVQNTLKSTSEKKSIDCSSSSSSAFPYH